MNSSNKIKNIFLKINYLPNNLIILYLAFGFLFLLLNFYFSFSYINKFPTIVDQENRIILENLGFNFNQIFGNLQNGEGFKANYFDTDYYVSRMPLIPLIFTFLYNNVSENFYIIFLLKNIFFFSLIFILLCTFKRDYKVFFVFFSLIAFFYNPHNLITSLSFNFEEGILNYLIIIFFLLYLSDIKIKFIFISIIISLIFFLKSSMVFFITAISLFFLFDGYKKYKFYYFPILFLIISNIIWGTYSYNKTGHFAAGIKLVSFNSFVLNHAYDEKFTSIYPRLSPDTLTRRIESKLPNYVERDEWEINKFYLDDSINYLKNNPKDVFLGILKKFQVVFFYIYKDSQFLDQNGNLEKEIRFSNFPNKIFFIIYLIMIIKSFIKNRDSKSIFYIISTIFYFFPYFVAFIYSRHCTAFYMIGTFYIYNEYYNRIVSNFFEKK